MLFKSFLDGVDFFVVVVGAYKFEQVIINGVIKDLWYVM